MKEKVIAAIITAVILLVISVIYGLFVMATGDFMRYYGNYGWAFWFEFGNGLAITLTWAFFTKQLLEVLEEDDES